MNFEFFIDPILRDELWRLRIELKHTRGRLNSILVAGPDGGEGATTVALHYGVAALEYDRSRVVLIDSDLRSATLTRLLGGDGKPGLRDWSGAGPLPVHESSVCPGLFILPAGQQKETSIASLAAEGVLEKVRTSLLNDFEEIVWDAPPITSSPDAKLVIPSSDGVLLVVASDYTPIESIRLARDQIAGAQGTVFAAIRNRTGRYTLGSATLPG